MFIVLIVISLSLILFPLLVENLNEYYLVFKKISKTGNHDANLRLPQNKLDLMSQFMEIKSVNTRIKQDQIAKDLSCQISNLQLFRQI